ncbi:MAG: IS3 family transposase [Nitrospirales bacterium]
MIQRCRPMFPVRLMCRLLHVSPSGYYARQRRPPSPWAQECQRLTAAIRTLHAESDGVYGSPKIWQTLRTQGEGGGKHRVARLMRREGLRGIPAPTRWKRRRAGTQPAGRGGPKNLNKGQSGYTLQKVA